MQKNSGNKIPAWSSFINSIKVLLDLLPPSVNKLRMAILNIGAIVVLVIVMRIEGGDLRLILGTLILVIGLGGMGIISSLRIAKNVLSNKERKDVEDLRSWKVFQGMRGQGMNIILNFIVISANTLRWVFFLMGLSIMSGLGIRPGDTNVSFYIACFLTLLWFPILDNLFLKRFNYVLITSFKFILTLCILKLMNQI